MPVESARLYLVVPLLAAACAAPPPAASPSLPAPSRENPAPVEEKPPPSVPLAKIGEGDVGRDAPEMAVPEGAVVYVVRRLADNPARRETWTLAEDGTRRVLRLVVETDTDGPWKAIGHAGWAGSARRNGEVAMRLVTREGSLPFAPIEFAATCERTRACTEEKPAVKKPGLRCSVTIEDETENVVLAAAPGLEGTVVDTCATPHVEPVRTPPMRGRMKHSIDF